MLQDDRISGPEGDRGPVRRRREGRTDCEGNRRVPRSIYPLPERLQSVLPEGQELNGPFLAAFDAAGGLIRSANIVTADWSLADHRGGFGYGNMKAKISLLPEAMFLKYKALLALDDWWWLATPYAGHANDARYVSADGSLYSDNAYDGYHGVRPAFFVESGIILESDGGEAVEGHE